jgi:DNA adenine methylase
MKAITRPIMRYHDTPQTLFYVDPPYMLDTRKMSGACYRHEMSDAQHADLLAAIQQLEGMVILSGYPHPDYNSALYAWHQIQCRSQIAAQSGSVMRTDVLWINPACRDALAYQCGALFQEDA